MMSSDTSSSKLMFWNFICFCFILFFRIFFIISQAIPLTTNSTHDLDTNLSYYDKTVTNNVQVNDWMTQLLSIQPANTIK